MHASGDGAGVGVGASITRRSAITGVDLAAGQCLAGGVVDPLRAADGIIGSVEDGARKGDAQRAVPGEVGGALIDRALCIHLLGQQVGTVVGRGGGVAVEVGGCLRVAVGVVGASLPRLLTLRAAGLIDRGDFIHTLDNGKMQRARDPKRILHGCTATRVIGDLSNPDVSRKE